MDLTLYKTDAKGVKRVWRAEVAGATVTYTYGVAGGKLQRKSLTYTEGKVKRTPEEQALQEAQAKARVKQRGGYVFETRDGDGAGADVDTAAPAHVPSNVVETAHLHVPRPMLALTKGFLERLRFVDTRTTPTFVQRKLDGVRATGNTGTGELWTRQCKRMTAPTHIENALRAVGAHCREHGTPLPEWVDGELYQHGASFNAITGAVRQKTVKDVKRLSGIQYHLYDVHADVPTRDRLAVLDAIADAIDALGIDEIVVVETFHEHPGEDAVERISAYLPKFVAEGYEGAMVRVDDDTPYEAGKRSSKLLKLKNFHDADFEFVECVPEKGREDLVGAMVLRLPDGRQFSARPAMTEAERRALWDTVAPGDIVTVKYFELTPDGIPRFPSAVGVRVEHTAEGPV